jgi:hypothetical protein
MEENLLRGKQDRVVVCCGIGEEAESGLSRKGEVGSLAG